MVASPSTLSPDRSLPTMSTFSSVSLDHFHIIARKYAFPSAYATSPPIRLTFGALDNGDNVALFEAQIAGLIGVKGEFRYCLAWAGATACD